MAATSTRVLARTAGLTLTWRPRRSLSPRRRPPLGSGQHPRRRVSAGVEWGWGGCLGGRGACVCVCVVATAARVCTARPSLGESAFEGGGAPHAPAARVAVRPSPARRLPACLLQLQRLMRQRARARAAAARNQSGSRRRRPERSQRSRRWARGLIINACRCEERKG